ncbi:MAG: glycoside hydrolase family 113 [Tepidisphaerales bacterium]
MILRSFVIATAGLWAMLVGVACWSGAASGGSEGNTPSADRAGASGARPGGTTGPSAPPSADARNVLPFRSVTVQLQRVDWVDRYEQAIDEIADLGADTVKFVVDPRMEHGESNRIYLDLRMVPSTENLKRLIAHAKARGLRVILMPIVLLDAPRKATEWRGTIKPESWDRWFESYTDMMVHFAWIAQASGVDLLVVGSELVSTERQATHWSAVIRRVRSIYSGLLTYSANWDHYHAVPFWDQLDLIGMNSYWALDEGNGRHATVEDIRTAWRNIQADLLPFAAAKGKPIIFLEAGWCSLANAAHEPWDYTRLSEPIDLDLQRRLYQGFFESWYGHPQLGGFSIWEWPPEAGGERDRGYTPRGKPAERVLRSYLAKPPWRVDPSPSATAPASRRGTDR